MNKDWLRTHRWEVGIALLTLLTNAICFWALVHLNGTDVLTVIRVDDGFYELAENVLAGNGFTWSQEAPYQPNSMRTPGYVWLLAGLIAVFGTTGAAIVQLLAATAIPLMGMVIARMITGKPWIGIITGLVLALDPTVTQLSFQFYTETAFLLFFFAWLIVTLRYFKRLTLSLLCLSALLFGASLLIKASMQYLPLLLIPCIIWAHGLPHWRRSVLHIGVFLAIVGLILTPWVIRNAQVFDTIGFSTQSTFVLFTNFAPAVITVAENRDFVEVRDAFLTPAEFQGDAITFANQDEYKARAIEVITSHPVATVQVMAKSAFTFFTNDGFYTLFKRLQQDPNDYFFFLVFMRLVWIAITGAALVGALVYLFKKCSPQTLLVVGLVGYLALVSTVAAFGTNPRYRLPVDPIIIAMAAVGASTVLYQIKNVLLPRSDTPLKPFSK